MLIIVLSCIVVGIFVAFLISGVLNQRPEIELSKKFLVTCKPIADYFGQPLTISYKSEGAKIFFSFSDKSVEGRYRFAVSGSKESGMVEVSWRSGDDNYFQVKRVELLRDWKAQELPQELLWKEGENF